LWIRAAPEARTALLAPPSSRGTSAYATPNILVTYANPERERRTQYGPGASDPDGV